MFANRGNDEKRLDALFQAYRAACPDPEPGVNFMPLLWRRIEARQTFTFSFRRRASAFVTAALALTIAMGVYMAIPNAATYASQSYLEVLAEANSLDTPEIVGPVRLELSR